MRERRHPEQRTHAPTVQSNSILKNNPVTNGLQRLTADANRLPRQSLLIVSCAGVNWWRAVRVACKRTRLADEVVGGHRDPIDGPDMRHSAGGRDEFRSVRTEARGIDAVLVQSRDLLFVATSQIRVVAPDAMTIRLASGLNIAATTASSGSRKTAICFAVAASHNRAV